MSSISSAYCSNGCTISFRPHFNVITVATWNINSAPALPAGRALSRGINRMSQLQETKCPDENFPRAEFERIGYGNIALHGQKGWHGVATVSKSPFADIARDRFCEKNDARHVAVTFERTAGFSKPLTIHNFYVPAGGDEPTPRST
jgi:exodeoxyribonuclease-3